MPVTRVYCVLNCERGFAKPFLRRRHCRRLVKCLLAELIVSWIVSEVSPSFALFQICECLFSRFVVSSYGRGLADNLYDKSMVVICKFISRVHCDFSCGRDLGFVCGYKLPGGERVVSELYKCLFLQSSMCFKRLSCSLQMLW